MIAHTDGACRVSNPGYCSAAFSVYDGNKITHEESWYLGFPHSNNVAEYQALLGLLRWADKSSVYGLQIFCDSKLVVEQVNLNWQVKKEDLIALQLEASALLLGGCHILCHVDGHSGNGGNDRVDYLCNRVLDSEGK